MSDSRKTISYVFDDDVAAWDYLNAGVAELEAGDFHNAIAHFDACLSLKPNDEIAHWNLALALLSIGDYRRGFVELEWRWRVFDWCWGLLDRGTHEICKVPDWRGEDLSGKRLIYLHEQGFGDAILMLRYLPKLIATGADITAMTVQPLCRLIEQFGVKTITGMIKNYSDYDYRCPVFGPMVVWQQQVTDVPMQSYIAANFRPQPRTIGICWSGRSQKSFTLDEFLRRLDWHGFDVFSLQPDAMSCIHPLVATNFFETARLIEQVEHVVTIDSAVANLAGAMGHPSTHVLLTHRGDWRWYNSKAWYPLVKTYRQEKPGDWSMPFARLNEALHGIAG